MPIIGTGLPIYTFDQALNEAGLSGSYPILASEFGGPHPLMENIDQTTQAKRLVSYIHTLEDLGVRYAFFF